MRKHIYISYPCAPIPSASGFGVGFGYLTPSHRVFGALEIYNKALAENKVFFPRGG